jgi:hypothetical protein
MTPPPGLRVVLGNSLELVRTVRRRSLVLPPLRDRDKLRQVREYDEANVEERHMNSDGSEFAQTATKR